MIIFHIDVNSAFLSWSAVKRLEEDPESVDLRTIPSIVGGDQATRHGIVTAKSIPAKKYGIRTAEPVAQAMKKCPGLVVVKSDFKTYRRYSDAFMKILRKYTPVVEKASIDEAYLDVTDLREKYRYLETPQDPFPVCLARRIRDEIRDTLGFTVNVGISTNKLLAKMASDFEKPDRIHTLYPEEIPEKMWPLPVRELYGCGARTAARLEEMGMHTIGDAARAPEDYLQSVLGEKAGEYIWRSANGIGSVTVRMQREEVKSCSNEVTTPYDITLSNYEKEMLPLLKKLSEKVAGRLQKDGFYAGTVVVTVKTSEFVRRSIQAKLPDPTNRGEILYAEAKRLAGQLLLGDRKDGKDGQEGLLHRTTGIRLVGVGTTDLDHGEYRQMSLADLLSVQPAAVQPAAVQLVSDSSTVSVSDHSAVSADDRPAVPGPGQAEKNSVQDGGREQRKLEKRSVPRRSRAEKEEALTKMAQKIRNKYGNDAIRRGM